MSAARFRKRANGQKYLGDSRLPERSDSLTSQARNYCPNVRASDTSTERYKREIFAHCPCLPSPRCMLRTRGIVDGKAATISSVAYACSARGVLLIFYAKSVKAPWPVRAKSTANSVDTAYRLLVKKLMNFSGLMGESFRNYQNSMLHMYNCELSIDN